VACFGIGGREDECKQGKTKRGRNVLHAVGKCKSTWSDVGRNNQRALRRMKIDKHPVQCAALIAPYASYAGSILNTLYQVRFV
jgi:hypothetical protein